MSKRAAEGLGHSQTGLHSLRWPRKVWLERKEAGGKESSYKAAVVIQEGNEARLNSQRWQWDCNVIYGFNAINIHESMLL